MWSRLSRSSRPWLALLCWLALSCGQAGPLEAAEPAPSFGRRLVLAIEGLDCGGCAERAADALFELPLLRELHVDFRSGRAVLAGEPGLSVEAALELLSEAGFAARPLRHGSAALRVRLGRGAGAKARLERVRGRSEVLAWSAAADGALWLLLEPGAQLTGELGPQGSELGCRALPPGSCDACGEHLLAQLEGRPGVSWAELELGAGRLCVLGGPGASSAELLASLLRGWPAAGIRAGDPAR